MQENYEDSWDYTDPISNEEIAEQVYKGRAAPLHGEYYDQ